MPSNGDLTFPKPPSAYVGLLCYVLLVKVNVVTFYSHVYACGVKFSDW
jgi:hypothetical protein